MKKTIITLGLLAVLFIGGTYAYSQGPGSGPGPGPGSGPHWGDRPHWGRGDFGSPLNLTPEQKTKLKELGDKFRNETVLLRNSLKVKRLELQALWTTPRPERDKIIAKEKEIIDLTTQLKMKAIDFRLEARGLLTPEQAAQVGMWGPGMWHRGHLKRRMMEEH